MNNKLYLLRKPILLLASFKKASNFSSYCRNNNQLSRITHSCLTVTKNDRPYFRNIYNTIAKCYSSSSIANLNESQTNAAIQKRVIGLQSKKRPSRKKALLPGEHDPSKPSWSVVAHSTSEEYDLEALAIGLQEQALYQQSAMPEDMNDVLHVSAKYQVGREPREVYFFREGSVVFWNVPELERIAVLKFLKTFENNSYDENLVSEENEVMEYYYTDNKTRLVSGTILLNSEGSTDLEKYAFSNGIALSVTLGIWEASLDAYVDSIEWITNNMKDGKKITMSRDTVFRKTGELFALRHLINLSSDLLDTPDFYWDRQNLENLFQKTCNHLNVAKRTKVMNEKLNHCCELMELISNHLNDKHHVRLEWMIIVLIMVEVVFEFIHYGERFYS